MTYDPEYQKKWYEANKETHKEKVIARNNRYRKEMRAEIAALKEAQPCTDCGVSYPSYVMQYDHIGDDKVTDVAKAITRMWSRKKIYEEIAKCELVCANCHAIRTHTRR